MSTPTESPRAPQGALGAMTDRAALGRWRLAVGWLFLTGAVNVIVGLIPHLSGAAADQQQGTDLTSVVVGGVFLLLGVFAAFRMRAALDIAILLGILYGIFGAIIVVVALFLAGN